MTTMTIKVENASILPSLKKVLEAMDGVSIVKQERKSKKQKDITQTAGYKEAMEDKASGRVSGPFNNADDLFKHLGI